MSISSTSPDEVKMDIAVAALKQHVTDAAIAAQLAPPTDRQFLDKCERVAASRDKLRRESC